MKHHQPLRVATALASALLAVGCAYGDEPTPYPPSAPAAEAVPPPSPAARKEGWPRVFQAGAETVSMYQPQIEQWDDESITFRAAIAVASADGVEPVYGMVRTTARADVDKAARIVTLRDFHIVKVSFPTAPEKNAPYLAILTQRLPAGAKEISLDRLEASAAVSQAVKKQRGMGVKNDPPRILFSMTPALLVLVDGDAVLRPTAVAGVERVVNTHALIVRAGGAYYLTAMGFWYLAPAISGPWTPLDRPLQFLAQVRDEAAAAKQVDLMEPDADAPPLDAPPAVCVSTVPAELIQTDGVPELIPIEGTRLLQAQNSDDAIFVDQQTAEFYVLISGRWFKSPSLDRGPWQFVPAGSLPPDFARIPPDNPRANVLVSVPGTPEAREALIANCIPQTAVVERGEAAVDLLYDGAADGQPQFEAIEGAAPLNYAVNASLPVIAIAPDSFFCVQNGIWFVALSPFGPWVVATAVPAAIYAIPISCPIHYVTYCRIYGFTPQVVYAGYMPGYLGTVVSSDGLVVFGTGYRYRPHVGRAWNAWPCTYGFNAGFACGPETGFAFGFASGIFGGGRPEPYWGPYDWGFRHGYEYRRISVNHADVYEHWHGNVVSIPRRADRARPGAGARLAQTPFNPYSARRPVVMRAMSAMPAAAPAARREKLDWTANAQPRPNPGVTRPIPPMQPVGLKPMPQPIPARPPTGLKPMSQPLPPMPPTGLKPMAQPISPNAPGHPPVPAAPVVQPNNVFVTRTGDIYRHTTAPPRTPAAPRPAPTTTARPMPAAPALVKPTAPATEPSERDRPPVVPRPTTPILTPPPVVTPRPTPPVSTPQPPAMQWEERTKSGWQPVAPQNPAFRKAAPELNREAAARDAGQTRANRAADIAPRASTPIVPSRPEPSRAPMPTPAPRFTPPAPTPSAPAPRFTPSAPSPTPSHPSGSSDSDGNSPSRPGRR